MNIRVLFENNALCVFGVFLAFVALLTSLLFILFVTVLRKTNFFVNLYWDNKYSDSDSDTLTNDAHYLRYLHTLKCRPQNTNYSKQTGSPTISLLPCVVCNTNQVNAVISEAEEDEEVSRNNLINFVLFCFVSVIAPLSL